MEPLSALKSAKAGFKTRSTQAGVSRSQMSGFLEHGVSWLHAGARIDIGSRTHWLRRGAALIRLRLCGSHVSGLPVLCDDQFSTQRFSFLPLAPGGRGALRSSGVRGPPSALNSTKPLGLMPLPLEGEVGTGTARKEGVNGPGIPSNGFNNAPSNQYSINAYSKRSRALR